ncbi:MAG TPA: hypothetical protein DEA22_01025 [Blastocatellia bacterium]|nr:hypothetical protein [Blastocatellia bacterium]
MDRRVFHIRDKLSQNLGRRWSVDDMAAEVKMSAAHFKRLFKEETGVNPTAYLQAQRLERARELLSDTQCYLGVKEIGYQIGITNKGQFTREFRKLTGFTPTEFREMYAAMERSNSQTEHE